MDFEGGEIDWQVLMGDWEVPAYYLQCLNDYLKSTIPHLALQDQLYQQGRENSFQELNEQVKQITLLGGQVLASVIKEEPEGTVVSMVKE